MDDDRLLIELGPDVMQNPRYSVVVRRYLFGQLRIQICDQTLRDPFAPPPHGSIVREMDTYRMEKLAEVLPALRSAPDPLALCREWETPANCEAPGRGRIRLDTSPDDYPRAPVGGS